VSLAESLVFGLTVAEWSILLTALVTFAGALWERMRANKGEGKLEAVMEAIEEVHQMNPQAGKMVKTLARDKATKMGLEAGRWGLQGDTERLTRKLKRKPEAPTGKVDDGENHT